MKAKEESMPLPMDESADNDAVMDHVALEAMHAIETKDKAMFKNAFHVLVVDILDKMSGEMDEPEDDQLKEME